MAEGVWEQWAAGRPQSPVLHLDSAAAGRTSLATLAAVAGHARRESEIGAYVAAERAQRDLARLRADVAGLLGTDPDGVAFVESATAGLDALLGAWPLEPGSRVGVAASEWGPNLEMLAHRGLELVPLEVDPAGVLDLDALSARLADDPPDLVHLDLVAAQRGLVQPAQAVIDLAGEVGVPVWMDAAQALGHVAMPVGADAIYATGRKWLAGPRAVGMLAVAPSRRDSLRLRRLTMNGEIPDVRHLESGESHVAGRVGLGVAVREHLDLGPERVHARLAEVGARVREAVESVPGWEVVAPEAPAGATTALAATAGQDVLAERERLHREHQILTTACLPWRAPREMVEGQRYAAPWLRLSPHVDLDDDGIERLLGALGAH